MAAGTASRAKPARIRRAGVTMLPSILTAVWADDSGQDLVEYAVLVLILLMAVGATILLFRDRIGALFQTSADGLADLRS